MRLLPLTWLCLSLSLSTTYAQDDGLNHDLPSDATALTGQWDLWQDGEGGATCPLRLTDELTVGGLAVHIDATCAEDLGLSDTPHAWFLRQDGALIISDATRQVLLQLSPLPDGSFRDVRNGEYVDAVLLTRP
ncbi:AprI/Inh family metalloprotease inhibitor [Pseudomonas sp. NCCP-436]|uniref:AprI/Inh family metalloprotease inhibitor n=1 Tax=Pseudomonas sp. NCCP-436 TaxID=2842481 RepID=UPI001C81D63E|nr:AprI/Inh family metalloprotease inhibitor [Pseudomonas sp. NCCP-436]GIZ12939.1 hypothetical protein NCCP436_23550 [Pseudomonas sp. NCCP-436]